MNDHQYQTWAGIVFALIPVACALAGVAIAPMQMEALRNYNLASSPVLVLCSYFVYLIGMALAMWLIHQKRVSKVFMWTGAVFGLLMFLLVQTIYPISIFLRPLYSFFAWRASRYLPGFDGLVFGMFAFILASCIVESLPDRKRI